MALARIKRARRGGYWVRLTMNERDALRTLPGELRSLLVEGASTDDPALRRLYPPGYLDDPERAADLDSLIRDDLTAQRLEAIATMERTIDADRLTEDELVAWLAALNDLRLVLGTRLGVSEDAAADLRAVAGDEHAERMLALYGYLSHLEEEIVGALAAG